MTPPLNTLTASLQPAEMSFQDQTFQQKKGHPCPAAYINQMIWAMHTLLLFIQANQIQVFNNLYNSGNMINFIFVSYIWLILKEVV